MKQQSGFRSGFVTIIGRPNVGKSTLMNALIGEKISIISAKPQTTRNRIMGVLSGDGYQIVILDTPGLHRPRTQLGEYMVKAASDALEGTDLVMVMADVNHIGKEDRTVFEEMQGIRVPRILILNKCDLAKEETVLHALESVRALDYDDVIPVSAKSGLNLDDLMKTIVAHLPEGPKYFPEDMVTDQPERLICAEIIREKALCHLQEEVPHGIGVEMMAIAEASETLTQIHATIYCEKQSHKGIIIGKGGAMLRTIGEESRHDIERLLGKRVHLQLWVKVRKDWRNRKGDLRALGYEV